MIIGGVYVSIEIKTRIRKPFDKSCIKNWQDKTFYATKAIEQQLDDIEDYYLAEQSYNEWVAEGKKTYSFDEVFN